MIKTPLYVKLQTYDFKKLFAKKGYAFFTKGAYNLNIIGVRNRNNIVTNKFDDYIVIIYNTEQKENKRVVLNATTDPGAYYMYQPMNENGCAILVPGQYRGCWKYGFHKRYRALVQCKPVRVYRDKNKNDIYDFNPTTIQKGIYGINIHKAGINSLLVDKWSAGCQVIPNNVQYTTFINLCKKQIDAGLGDTFTYTLLDENELL